MPELSDPVEAARHNLWNTIHAHHRAASRHGDGHFPEWDADEESALAVVEAAVVDRERTLVEAEDEEWMNTALGVPSRRNLHPTVASQLGALYDYALLLARATARECGYALAVHGSELHDLDLLAVPWIEEAKSPEELAEAIRKAVNGTFSAGTQTGHVVSERPHGRLSWAIHLESVDAGLADALAAGPRPFHPYIDLSVMFPEAALEAEKARTKAPDIDDAFIEAAAARRAGEGRP